MIDYIKIEKNKGITLTALVVTIIILFIIAAVSVSFIKGENGLYGKTKDAGKEYTAQAKNEEAWIKHLIDENYVASGSMSAGKIPFKNCTITVSGSNTLNISGVSDILSASIVQNEKILTTIKTNTYSPLFTPVGETSDIYVYVIDTNGNLYKSNTINYEGKAYCLYNEGDQCEDITGGWVRGNYNCGSVDIDSNNYMTMQGIKGTKTSNSINTKNLIDFSEYTKFYVELEYDQVLYWSSDKRYYTYFPVGIANPRFASYDTSNIKVWAVSSSQTSEPPKYTRLIYSADIPAGTKGYPTAAWINYNASMYSPANLKIYKMWVEK